MRKILLDIGFKFGVVVSLFSIYFLFTKFLGFETPDTALVIGGGILFIILGIIDTIFLAKIEKYKLT